MVSAGPVATSIPNVIGLREEDAKAALVGAGYQVETKTTYDERFEEGLVVSQAPEAGTAAEPGTLVTIVVSKGKNPEATVPDVVGMTEAEAAKVLQDAGFEVVPAASFSDAVPSGSVINQDPEAGATALIGSAVSITVSQGLEPPDTAIVPDVVGMTEAEATEVLTQAGYEVAAARAFNETIAKDVVAWQAPMAGSVTEPGITVGMLVSDGPRPGLEFVLVPDLTGMTLEEATAVLEQAGLQVVSFEFSTELAPEGQVFAQLPPAESSVAPGSTVLVIVSKGPYVQVNPL
jgi:beta-lactam-binding protein with PASTA domain